MLLRITHHLRRRIKTHRLAVEQRSQEHIGVMAFDPGRGIDQKRKARGVAFRKTIFAKAFNLLEAVLDERAGVAAIAHALDETFSEKLHFARAPKGRHRAAQL